MTNQRLNIYDRLSVYVPVITGATLLSCALVCSQTVARWLDSQPPLAPPMIAAIRTSQTWFVSIGATLILFGVTLRMMPAWRHSLNCSRITPGLLTLTVMLTPILIVELGFRPLAVGDRWTLYQPDNELAWKHRPGAKDYLVQLPVVINSRGVRGPEFQIEKESGTKRVLFLGDSVTFGHGIVNDGDTIPAQVERMLNDSGTVHYESINFGVCGYSPWQYLGYLKRDGLQLHPDVVITNFVLNDVTEKFSLPQFGGNQSSGQLDAANMTRLPDWLAQSGTYYLIRSAAGFLRFGPNARQAATAEEALGVRSLSTHPDDPAVKKAWRITLENMRRIDETVRNAGARHLVVVYPFRFQLEPDASTIPQETLADFCVSAGIPVLDLLPVLRSKANDRGAPALFLDTCHLTEDGAAVTARTIADVLLEDQAASPPPLLARSQDTEAP